MSNPSRIDIYPQSRLPRLDENLFRHPTSEYRGAPFWSWNNKLDEQQLLRQIDYFKQMGFGGFHMHSRIEMATEYLGEQFMQMVRACTRKAADEGLLAWLYDEDRWPSGFAGGLVTRDPQYRAKHLRWTCQKYSGQGTPIGRYEVRLENGRLAGYRRLNAGEAVQEGGRCWEAWLETVAPSAWFNNQSYVDTLSRPAIERFVEVTHEAYKKAVGERFGTVVPAIFTDEPQFPRKEHFKFADDTCDLTIPFTTDFLDSYRVAWQHDLADHLPELFWELPRGRASAVRWRYHDHVVERFASAFADTIGAWCDENGIALTGNVNDEQTLKVQTSSVGEAMRSYRSFQIPGIDLLVDNKEWNTAKQCQSAARQYGRCGALSELYGVTNWDFDFAGHKGQGDWQAAMGITVRVPHLSWVSMAGEAKRDYPASIFYQSPWYREYPLVENHFARLNTVLTRGTSVVRVGVIHPIESFWLAWGPLDQTRLAREEAEKNFAGLTDWLLLGLHDFDFISEALLPGLCPLQSATARQLPVGQMRYDAVVVPAMRTIRSSTLERLEAFVGAGGTVIFAGEIPSLVDALPSERAKRLAASAVSVPFSRLRVLEALADLRELEIQRGEGGPVDSFVHQLRQDGELRYAFIVNTDRKRRRDNCRIRLKGEWTPERLDTMSGEIGQLPATDEDGWTMLRWSFAAHDHLLLRLTPGRSQFPSVEAKTWRELSRLADPVPVTLDEPNALLLDQARWRFDGGAWNAPEEILRIDDEVRTYLGLPKRGGEMAQPWTCRERPQILGTLELAFTVRCDVAIDRPCLALEDLASTRIFLDGAEVPQRASGWWVDEAISKAQLPSLAAGEHELTLAITFTRASNIEWCYLLGDFSVQVAGRHARVGPPVKQLAFGNWTRQGLPFYGGSVTYHCRIEGDGQNRAIQVPKFAAPLLSAAVDGQRVGPIAFAPYRLELGLLAPGDHRLDLTAYGNRYNSFAALHNTDETVCWFGPGWWRSRGTAWAYEYQLKRTGILTAPPVLEEQ